MDKLSFAQSEPVVSQAGGQVVVQAWLAFLLDGLHVGHMAATTSGLLRTAVGVTVALAGGWWARHRSVSIAGLRAIGR